MRCPEIVALTGELLLPFNIFFFLACFLHQARRTIVPLGFPPLTPYCWTLTWLFPPFFMISERLKMFIKCHASCGVFSPLYLALVFYKLLEDREWTSVYPRLYVLEKWKLKPGWRWTSSEQGPCVLLLCLHRSTYEGQRKERGVEGRRKKIGQGGGREKVGNQHLSMKSTSF